MYWLLALMTLSLLGIIGLGIYYEMYPPTAETPRRVGGKALSL